MKNLIALCLLSLFLFACSDDENNDTKTGVSETASVAAPSLTDERMQIMKYIPADTPLLMLSGTSKSPERYLEAMQEYVGNAGKYLEIIAEDFFSEYNKYSNKANALDSDEENPEEIAANQESEMMQKNVREFYDTWFKDDAMSNLGFSIEETQVAIYAIDMAPVLRFTLSKNHKINEMLTDAKARFDLDSRQEQRDGYVIHYFDIERATVVVALKENQFVTFALPSVLTEKMEDRLLGIELPTQNLLENRQLITDANSKHGFVLQDVFILNMEQIADYFINSEKYDFQLLDFMQIEDDQLSAVCKSELSSLASSAPRIVMGFKHLDNTTMDYAVIWEMEKELTQDLTNLMGRIPQSNPDAAFSMGLSIDLLKGREMLSKYINKVVDAPFQCELLAQMNQNFNNFQAQINQPMPPFIGNFKGLNFSMNEFKVDESIAQDVMSNPAKLIEGLKMDMLFAVDQTESLIGMAQMMVPQLKDIQVNTDGTPINLADYIPVSGSDIPFDASTMFMALSGDTIGLSMGYTDGGKLGELVKGESQKALMTYTADGEKYRNLIEEVFSVIEQVDLSEDIKKELEQQKKMTLYGIWWKKQVVDLTFAGEGLNVDMNIVY